MRVRVSVRVRVRVGGAGGVHHVHHHLHHFKRKRALSTGYKPQVHHLQHHHINLTCCHLKTYDNLMCCQLNNTRSRYTTTCRETTGYEPFDHVYHHPQYFNQLRALSRGYKPHVHHLRHHLINLTCCHLRQLNVLST